MLAHDSPKVPHTILRRRRDFLRIQKIGRRLKGRYTTILIAPSPSGNASRIGFTVSRRVGNAVVRNRVRRRLREIARLEVSALCSGFEHVVIAFPSAAQADYSALRQEVLCLLKRLGQRASPRAP